MKTYKVTFFDCYDIFSVQTYHKATCAWSVLRNAAVQIVTLGLSPAIAFEVNGVQCDDSKATRIVERLCEEIEPNYIDKYFDRMEQEGRL